MQVHRDMHALQHICKHVSESVESASLSNASLSYSHAVPKMNVTMCDVNIEK